MAEDKPLCADATPIYDALTPEEHLGQTGAIRARGWLLAIDEDSTDGPLDEVSVVLCPANGATAFTVFRATSSLALPDGACLSCDAEPMPIIDGDYQYTVLRCRLVRPDEPDRPDADRLLTVPPELAGRTIQETAADSERLWNTILARAEAFEDTDPADP